MKKKEDGDSFFDMGTSQFLEITPEQMENLKKIHARLKLEIEQLRTERKNILIQFTKND